ncbi:Pentatricopeptide repeat-containing protein [Camellia lanceoleosa]|uniref:Pentatricopeptide repeat-containing protein n=1 Tax=Camellia lanceoleosa TaxID=1840588 RepID=A0ACC0FWX1_9ERIC|nr:Pentatricopeptide repeat-containing protein [Camellia lanceoleosa]
MKVEDKLSTWETLDAVIRAYLDSGLVDKALEIYTTVLSTSNSVPSVLACNSLLNALVKEGRIEIASRVYDEMFERVEDGKLRSSSTHLRTVLPLVSIRFNKYIGDSEG